MVTQASLSLLNELAASWLRTNDTLTGADSDSLSDEQIARLRELQSEVISDREAVGKAISSVDWTFGDFAGDVAAQAVNLGSQAVAAIADATGIDWTWVKIGVAVGAGLAVLYVGRRLFP